MTTADSPPTNYPTKNIGVEKEVEELLQPISKISLPDNKALVNTCYDYAIEGEKLSRANDFPGCIKYFTAALCCGTDDYKLLSAIYSQLGNAFFSLQDFIHALDYHKWDLNISRINNDLVGEAKASGNLGNTLKKLGKFDEAILCNQRQVDIVRQISDKALESRSLYNLATAYMDKGIAVKGTSESEDSEEKKCFEKAQELFNQNLKLSQELKDHAFEGVLEGSLGTLFYLLQDYNEAMVHYKKRLTIAKEFGDIRAKRRARVNLANTQMMAKDIIGALKNYLKAYQISMQLNEISLIPTLCQQLGYCCTLLQRPLVAIIYHLRGLSISLACNDNQLILDALVELIKAYCSLDETEFEKKSRLFYTSSLLLKAENEGLQYSCFDEIKEQFTDIVDPASTPQELSEESAKCRDPQWLEEEIKEIYSIIKYVKKYDCNKEKKPNVDFSKEKSPEDQPNDDEYLKDMIFEHVISGLDMVVVTLHEDGKSCSRHPFKNPDQIIFETYDGDNKSIMNQIPSINSSFNPNSSKNNPPSESQTNSHEDFDRFLSLVSQVQSRRLDEQRCNLPTTMGPPQVSTDQASGFTSAGQQRSASFSYPEPQTRNPDNANGNQENDENFFNLVAGIQSLRMDDQRASLPDFPGLIRGPSSARLALSPIGESGSVMRNNSNPTSSTSLGNAGPSTSSSNPLGKAIKQGSHTNAAFFEMIMRCQADTRIDDQRSTLPTNTSGEGIGATSFSGHSVNTTNSLPLPSKTIIGPGNQDDFFDLVQKLQSNRYDEQRCYFPMLMNLNLPSNNPSTSVPQSSNSVNPISNEDSATTNSSKKKSRSNSTKKK